MHSLGYRHPERMLGLGDASMVVQYRKMAQGVREQESARTVVLPSRKYWTFQSYGPLLQMIIDEYGVNAIQFVEATFEARFNNEFTEVLALLPTVALGPLRCPRL